jgi:hypothetical protein
MTVTHGYCIPLTDGFLSVSGCETAEDAKIKAEDVARQCGYKPPSRWKFWGQHRWVKAKSGRRLEATPSGYTETDA